MIYDLIDLAIQNGLEDDVQFIVEQNLKDNNGNHIKVDDEVIYIAQVDDGLPQCCTLTISGVALDNIGCFTTYEHDTRYFHGDEVIKKENE